MDWIIVPRNINYLHRNTTTLLRALEIDAATRFAGLPCAMTDG